ncbi:MAG TPA: hypothetical protein VOA64_04405 [Candidatus Dormibacteraeota bacterium]|nr:hypothetical protein [Candidatus Dormibacteraeota bacterium]
MSPKRVVELTGRLGESRVDPGDIYVVGPRLLGMLSLHDRAIDPRHVRAGVAQPVFRPGKGGLVELPPK